MHITNLVAKELHLTEVKELEPFATINGVTIVDLEAAEGHFRVHLVRDSHETNVKLEEGSKLAAYYNSLFWHEASTAEKIPVPSAHFTATFPIRDGDVRHEVFITRSERTGTIRSQLGLAELEEVARQIAKLHAVKSKLMKEEFEKSVEENYGNIRLYRRKIQKDVIEILEQALNDELARYFTNPFSVLEKVRYLVNHLDNCQELEENKVITHGKLTAETCKFGENGELVEITEWENIHLGNPAEDLTNLIVTSADPEIRKKKFKKVFQAYFYALVDLHIPKYQLPDLKRWFKESQPKAVIDGIESLLLTLSESSDEHLKREAARRWELYLDDSVDYLTGNYVSDDEQTYLHP